MRDLRKALAATAFAIVATQAMANGNVESLRQLATDTPGSQSVKVAESYSCAVPKWCKHIRTCEEAHWYLNNCRWGKKLDRDRDGKPCEAGPC